MLAAYRTQRALRRRRHGELLDAAHIEQGSESGGPVLPNGIAMCAIHHRAFDSFVLGVRLDLVPRPRWPRVAQRMGSIHTQADRDYFDSHPDCRDLVRPMLAGFDITRAYEHRAAGSVLHIFYLKPERYIAEFLGLEREIMLAYAPFEQLQMRTIRLHDDVFEADAIRLDPVGTVLVADDPKTDSFVLDFLAQQPEHPPIVGLSRAQLLELRDANAIRAFFVKSFFNRDLFAFESPLKRDNYFFGRSGIVSELADRFRSGQNSGLFGLRRIGKTSVLFAVGRRCGATGLGGFLYVDLSNPSLHLARWWELLHALVNRLADAPNKKAEVLRRLDLHALSGPYDERSGSASFEHDIDILRRQHRKHRLLLALDEIENITFGICPAVHWNDDFLPFWQTLRAVHQDTQGEFCFIVAGVNPHGLEEHQVGLHDNPLFSTVRTMFLPPFEKEAVRQMVRPLGRYMGLRAEEGLFSELAREYGGHPFLIRQACSHLARRVPTRPGQLKIDLFQREKRAIAVALDKNVRQILSVLETWYPQEYELIQMLSAGDHDTFREFADASPEFTQHMEGYGLVQDARGNPRITLSLVQRHLVKRAREAPDAGTNDSDKEQVLAEISRRRNKIEIRLREVASSGIRFKYGRHAMEKLLQCIREDRRGLLSDIGYDNAWTELYFGELRDIVAGAWEAFQAWFSEDQEKVLSWLDHINRSRADAHARDISPEDLAHLRYCFHHMEQKLGVGTT